MATSAPTVTMTDAAKNYEPIGDPDHVAYASDFYWTCSCGKSGRFLVSESRAKSLGISHATECGGDITVDVSR